MKRRHVKRICDKLHRKLSDAGTTAQTAYDPEVIHIFRVTYKKLRAFARLLNSAKDDGSDMTLPKVIRDFYHSLGRIRDWQLLQAKLLQSEFAAIDMALINTVAAVQLVTCKRENQQVSARDLTAAYKLWYEKHVCNPIDLVAVELYIDNMWQDVQLLSEHLVSDQQIHAVRKKLKDIYYISTLMGSEGMLLYANGYLPGRPVKYFTGLMKELGEYNDLCISLNLLETAFNRQAETIGDTCIQVCNVLKKEKEKWYPALVDKIHQALQADTYCNQ